MGLELILEACVVVMVKGKKKEAGLVSLLFLLIFHLDANWVML